MVRASQGNKKSASVDMGTVFSNSPDGETHKKIETNVSNKFSISGENKSEKERTSKARKAVKSRQTVGAALTKQRVENMC